MKKFAGGQSYKEWLFAYEDIPEIIFQKGWFWKKKSSQQKKTWKNLQGAEL